jgi:hypothetical protein
MARPLRGVVRVSSIDQILGLLRAARTALEQAAAHAHQAAAQAGQIRDVGRATGVRNVVERFERLRARVEQVEAMISAGIIMVEEAIAETEATRGSGVRPSAELSAIGVPRHVVAAANDLPVRLNNRGPTRGLAFAADGSPLFGLLVSGRNVASTDLLRPVTGSKGWPWTFTDHVESAVAGRMRQPGGPREVTLVVNKTPCGDDPYGCDRILRDVLPAPSRLTVYVKDPTCPDGVRYHDTYEGTGRAVTS